MNRQHYLTNAILWASAIVASAILSAPTSLTLIVLPSLASCALVMTHVRSSRTQCGP